MSFKSFLSTVGHDLEKGLDFALKFEPAAEVGLTAAGFGPAAVLLHTTVGVVVSTEQKFQNVSGNGAQKLAQVVQILEPSILSTFAQYGVTLNTSGVQSYINAVVALLNALPPISTSTPTAASGVSVPVGSPSTVATSTTAAVLPPLNVAG